MTGQKAAAFFPSAADSDLDFASRARHSFFVALVAANEASVLFEEATSLPLSSRSLFEVPWEFSELAVASGVAGSIDLGYIRMIAA